MIIELNILTNLHSLQNLIQKQPKSFLLLFKKAFFAKEGKELAKKTIFNGLKMMN